jgi:hypothetical protein
MPEGGLTPTGEVQFWGRETMSNASAGERGGELPEALRKCEELALIEHVDEAGQHFTAFVDGTVFKAAMSRAVDRAPIGDVHVGDDVPVQRNWWVDEAWVSAHTIVWRTGWQGDADW